MRILVNDIAVNGIMVEPMYDSAPDVAEITTSWTKEIQKYTLLTEADIDRYECVDEGYGVSVFGGVFRGHISEKDVKESMREVPRCFLDAVAEGCRELYSSEDVLDELEEKKLSCSIRLQDAENFLDDADEETDLADVKKDIERCRIKAISLAKAISDAKKKKEEAERKLDGVISLLQVTE